MMNMKKLLALLLAIVMVVGMIPFGAMAEETDPSVPETTVAQETTVPETTAAATTEAEDGENEGNDAEGGLIGKILEGAKNILGSSKPEGSTETTGATETTGSTETTAATETTGSTESTTAPTETTAPTGDKTVCGNCGGEHETTDCKACVFCKNETCTCVTCDECGVKNDHNSTCSKYLCAECEKHPCECETEPTETTEAVEVCEYCGVELVEGAEHKEDCLSLCTCDPKPEEGEEHGEECPLYQQEPVSEVVADDGNIIKVDGIPEDAALQIGDPNASDLDEIMGIVNAQYGGVRTFFLRRNSVQPQRRTEKVVSELFSYDISILNVDGEEWQPGDEPVTVTLKIPGLKIDTFQKVCVAHMHDDEVKLIDAGFDRTAETITFTTDGFSTFYGFVVDFEFNGKQYSMGGKSEVELSILMASLDIGYDVEDVVDIQFTNPDVISVEKNSEGEWILTSIESFFTDEYLDISFVDGNLISILVTDPITLYYLTDTNGVYNNGTQSVAVGYKASGATVDTAYGSYLANTTKIDTKAQESGKYVIYDVYIHPGMALGLDSQTYSPHGNWTGSPVKSGAYTWVWDSTKSTNYYVIDSNIKTYTTQTIITYTGATQVATAACCQINLHIVPKKATPTLVEDTLSADSKYTIRELPITLYNYQGDQFNLEQKNATNNKYIGFNNNSMGVSATSLSGALPWGDVANKPNSGSVSTGIMKTKLDNNFLPVVNNVQNTDLFSINATAGKTVYENVDFQFIYNKQSGYYTYSSNLNHAQFVENENTIKLYNETLSPQVLETYNSSGSMQQPSQSGFYPFANINDAFVNYKREDEIKKWDSGALEQEFAPQNALLSKDFVYTSAAESTVDMHFGLQLVADFYMPVGRQVDNNNDKVMEDLVYQFTGDDDLWVFVDDTLVLDIGGAHTYVNGKIDFTNKTVTVGSRAVVTPNGSDDWNVGAAQSNQTLTFEQLGVDVAEDQMHTLRVFYLERWSGVSNCRMHFNLPIVPANSVVVNKSLTNQNGKVMDLGTSYKFQIQTKNADVHHETDYNTTRYKMYTVNNEKKTTDANGYFYLEPGQQAIFENITQFTDVIIKEFDPSEDGYTYGTSTIQIVNGSDTTVPLTAYAFGADTSVQRIQLNKSISYSFTNKVLTEDITVMKQLTGDQEAVNNSVDENVTKNYGFNITVNKPNNGGEYLNEDFTLPINNRKTFEDVPVGLSYTVTEFEPTAPGGYRYDPPKFNNVEVEFDSDDKAAKSYTVQTLLADGTNPNTITVINTLIAMYGDLTITKDGIQPVDHHSASGADKQEQQSSVFRIHGESAAGEAVDLEVVIVGNDSITIKQIPVGTYDVAEITDWSWRYNVGSVAVEKNESTAIENGRKVEVKPDGNTVTFTNSRDRVYWLSGDNYLWNLFNSKTVTNP